ncbi:hypothetical protein BJV78DRAFT_1285175 [Lactifluus subvellereus]|nr:hypothetical protein BJV78DRAFT_1285175 [Lactifluus subvellereus]
MIGAEHDAAIASTTKGRPRRRRLTSPDLVLVKDTPTRHAGQKSWWTLADLPEACTANNLFRKSFIPTYIKFVAQGSDPWTVNDLAAVAAMQKIWTAVYGKTIHYTVSTDGPVFAISTAESTTDEGRRTLAKGFLKDLQFLYSNSDSDDPQFFKGIFCGPLVLHTFAAHFISINGAVKVAGLRVEQPRSALVLAAAAVQRGLTLWATGTITLQIVLDAKGTRRTKPLSHKGNRNLTLPKTFTYDNGTKESISFNAVTWSKATSKYMDFINTELRTSSFKKIIEKAQEVIADRLQTDDSDAMDVDSIDDVQLVDLSDEDCKPFVFITVTVVHSTEIQVEHALELSSLIAAHNLLFA